MTIHVGCEAPCPLCASSFVGGVGASGEGDAWKSAAVNGPRIPLYIPTLPPPSLLPWAK